MTRPISWAYASVLASFAFATACAPAPVAPAAALVPPAQASHSPDEPTPSEPAPISLAASTAIATSNASAASPAPAPPTAKAPRRRAARPVTSDLAIDLVSRTGEEWGGETLHLARCPKGTHRANAEARIPLPATAFGVGLARGGDKIFAVAYLPRTAESEPTTSLLHVLDERLRVTRTAPLGAPRNGDTVSSLSIAADDRYLATYENDAEGADTATVLLLDANDLHVLARATVGASRALGNVHRQRLVLTEDDLYVLAPIFPARRERSTGNKVLHTAEEYILTRLALPNLTPLAQTPTGRHELGDLPLTLQNGHLQIEDDERVDTFTPDLQTHKIQEIPPRNAPPPPPKKRCGEK